MTFGERDGRINADKIRPLHMKKKESHNHNTVQKILSIERSPTAQKSGVRVNRRFFLDVISSIVNHASGLRFGKSKRRKHNRIGNR